jgi:hypothetical protein
MKNTLIAPWKRILSKCRLRFDSAATVAAVFSRWLSNRHHERFEEKNRVPGRFS